MSAHCFVSITWQYCSQIPQYGCHCYTGRAGNKGTAITFISQEEERYAPDLVKALKESGAAVPQDLQRLSDDFAGKCKAGTAHIHGSGFGGSGFKFDTGEEDAQKVQRQVLALTFLHTQLQLCTTCLTSSAHSAGPCKPCTPAGTCLIVHNSILGMSPAQRQCCCLHSCIKSAMLVLQSASSAGLAQFTALH